MDTGGSVRAAGNNQARRMLVNTGFGTVDSTVQSDSIERYIYQQSCANVISHLLQLLLHESEKPHL